MTDISINHINHSLTCFNKANPAELSTLTSTKVEKCYACACATNQISPLNLNSLNELKKDYTKIKILKNSYFDSNFNYLQSFNGNLSQHLSINSNKFYNNALVSLPTPATNNNIQLTQAASVAGPTNISVAVGRAYYATTLSAVLRAIWTIRINRDEWKLIRNLILVAGANNYSLFGATSSSGLALEACYPALPTASLLKSEATTNKKYINNFLNNNRGVVTNPGSLAKFNLNLSSSCTASAAAIGRTVNLFTNFSKKKNKAGCFTALAHYNKTIGYKFNSSKINPFYSVDFNKQLGFSNKKTIQTPLLTSYFNNLNNNKKQEKNNHAWLSPRKLATQPLESENIYIKDTYKLLFYLFKSMYCLISKPVLKFNNDKITIQLFYYLNIPKKKIFRLFSIYYLNSIKKKVNFSSAISLRTKIHNRWKLRKAISIFKIKNNLGSWNQVARADTNNLLFKLRKFNLPKATAIYQKKFNLICAILSKKFNKAVELQLIRLHHPYHNSNILLNLLSLNILNKRKKARVAIQKIFNNKSVASARCAAVKELKNNFLNHSNSLPYYLNNNDQLLSVLHKQNSKNGYLPSTPALLSGLNIKIAGRLLGEPIIPRITKKIYGKGASASGKVNYLDMARITKKNKKGAYTIKVTSGQNLF